VSRRHTQALCCPICGNQMTFTVVIASIQPEDWRQTAAMKFRRERSLPARFNPVIAPLIVCSACAHPLGMPPLSIVNTILSRRSRRS